MTDGPYAETVEQLTGFYLIESDDLDDLLECCKVLAQERGRPRGTPDACAAAPDPDRA